MGSPSTVDVAATGTKEFPLGGVGRTPPAGSLQEELAENHGSGNQKASQKQKLFFHGSPSTLLEVPFHTPGSIAHASDNGTLGGTCAHGRIRLFLESSMFR